MSSTITEHFTCDRCGATEDNSEATTMRPYGWSAVTIDRNWPNTQNFDLCDTCTDLVMVALRP